MDTPNLQHLASDMDTACTRCGACVSSCRFLQENGMPGDVGHRILEGWDGADILMPAFHCSLCGLCGGLCPENLQPAVLFHAMRCEAVRREMTDMTPYAPLIKYERIGRSRLLADRILPAGCDTIIFPGCTFSGTRPATLLALVRHLRPRIPQLGIVLDCCSKPSHDLGRMDAFRQAFSSLHEELRAHGIRRVITVCPNCQNVFRRYGTNLEVVTAVSLLAQNPPQTHRVHGHASQHIPCPLRGNLDEIEAIRSLAFHAGLTMEPVKFKGRRSPCCGEGGTVGRIRPDLAAQWSRRCVTHAGPHPLLTACAGCVNYLQAHTRALHILDLAFFPERTMSGHRADTGLKTYLNRILLRWRLRRELSSG